MTKFFNPKNMGFYDDTVIKAEDMPAGLIQITDEHYNNLMYSQSTGKQILANSDGFPYAGEPPLPSLDEAKKLANGAIESWRTAQEASTSTFTYNGHKWDVSQASKSRLDDTVAAAELGALPEGFYWTDADNIDVPMTTQDLIAFQKVLSAQLVAIGFKIHARQRQMKADIAALTTARAVVNYKIGW